MLWVPPYRYYQGRGALDAAAAGGGSTLRTSLTAWWEMNETTGDRVDAHGGNNLVCAFTDIPNATGLIGNAADVKLEADGGGILQSDDTAALSTGNIDFSIAGWIFFDALPAATQMIGGKWSSPGNQEWRLSHTGTGGANRLTFDVADVVSGADSVTASSFGALSISTWYLIVCVCDKTGGFIKISVNAGTQDSTAKTVTTPDGTAEFRLSNADRTIDARYDSWAFWKRAITPTEITQIYNAGAGLTYAATA